MASLTTPTLGDIRTAVAARCGLSPGGTLPRNIQSRVDERIRSAHAQLYESFPWTRQLIQLAVPLDDGETDYDVPDETSTGNITYLLIRRVSDNATFQLLPGLRPQEIDARTPVIKTLPRWYTFIDDVIRLEPAPDVTLYSELVVWCFREPNGLTEDGDPILVDSEAIKSFAEILVKEDFGKPVGQLRLDLFGGQGRDGYLTTLKMKQGDGGGFQMGGHQSAITKTRPRSRAASADYRDWHPW